MTALSGTVRRTRLALEHVDLDVVARVVLSAAILAAGTLLLHLSRGSSFWADEWDFILHRRGGSLDTFLAPHNGHLSLVPVAIYKLLFAVFGIDSYTPYRIVVTLLSLLVGVLVFVYARPRVGEPSAALLAILMLFLGPGWQNTVWPFQMAWLVVCLAGVGALMLLERHGAAADITACALTVVAVASTSLGLAVLIGVALEVALTRRRWQSAWIAAIPLVLYVIWSLHYHPSGITLSALPTIPLAVAQAAAAGISGLAGLSGTNPADGTGQTLIYGWPLLVAGIILAGWRARTVRPPLRAITLAGIFVVFSALISIAHNELASPLSSRYVYVYALLTVLLVADLGRGGRLSRPVIAALAALALAAVISNVGILRGYGNFFRSQGATTNGALAAVDIDRAVAPANTPVHVALYPAVVVDAGGYRAAARELGSPAFSLSALRSGVASGQSAADQQLVTDGELSLVSVPRATAAKASTASGTAAQAAPPAVATNGTIIRHGRCARFTPVAVLPPGASAGMTLTGVTGTWTLSASSAAATVTARRFAPTDSPLGTLAAGGLARLTIRTGSAPDPWKVTLTSAAPVQVCDGAA